MLLKDLVEIESPSGYEDKIKAFVIKRLEDLGYDVIEDEKFVAVNPKSELIVATHLDTIKVRSKFRTDGVYAYGTGVCDAKANVAAMLRAAESGLDYTLAFFCDEEEGGTGSKDFAKKWRWGKAAIVMEPTDLKIANKHFGCFDLEIEVRGVESHGATPEKGVNAIELCCEALQKLKAVVKATVTKIHGGSDEYVVPGSCKAKIDVLLDVNDKLNDVMKRIEFLRDYGDFKISDAYEGFESGRVADILAEAIAESGLKVEYTVMPSWTDAQNLKERYDVVVWGPGELHLCHTDRERIRLDDIERAAKVLVNLNEIYKRHLNNL